MIRSVAVLGAGVMGAQIAAHVANAGVPALLLDVTTEAAAEGLKRARALKPDPFFTPDTWKLVTTGQLRPGLRQAERGRLDHRGHRRAARREARAARARRPGARGLARSSARTRRASRSHALAEGRSDDFRRHWLGHALLQPAALPASAGDHSDRGNQSRRRRRGELVRRPPPRQGRRDREGLAELHRQSPRARRCRAAALARRGGRVHDRGDRRDDRAGRSAVRRAPRSARSIWPASTSSFTSSATCTSGCPTRGARRDSCCPPFVERMLAKGLIGEKSGQGFYKRVKGAGGESEILTLDHETLEYRPRKPPKLPSLDAANAIADTGERIKTLFNGKDRVGRVPSRDAGARPRLRRQRHTRHRRLARRRRSRDAMGIRMGARSIRDGRCDRDRSRDRRRARSRSRPAGRRYARDLARTARERPQRLRDGDVPPAAADLLILRAAKDRSKVVKKNPGASLVDLGDGVLRRRVPLEDERDRRRHDPDAAGRRARSANATSPRWSSATRRCTSPPART